MTDTKPALPKATEVTMWKKPACVQCMGATLHFKSKKITPAIKELFDEANADALAAFKANGIMQAPILQFPDVYDGDELVFEAQTVTGNRVDVIDDYAAAIAKVAARAEERELALV